MGEKCEDCGETETYMEECEYCTGLFCSTCIDEHESDCVDRPTEEEE